MNAAPEFDTFGQHLFDTPIDEMLFHLEIGNAVAQQAADAVGLLEYRNVVTGAHELLGGGETGGAGPAHRNALVATHLLRLGVYPPLAESTIDDALLELCNAHGRVAHSEPPH